MRDCGVASIDQMIFITIDGYLGLLGQFGIQAHLAIHNLNYSYLLKINDELKIFKQFLFCVSGIIGKYCPRPATFRWHVSGSRLTPGFASLEELFSK